MSLASAVVDRVFREYLLPPSDRPVQVKLSAAITSTTATSVSYDASMVSADEEEVLSAGHTIEFGSELMRIESGDATANTLTVIRAVDGTTAATHAINAIGTVDPTYPRKVVFDAVCDQIMMLWPDFFKRVKGHPLTTASTPVDVPAAVAEVERFLYEADGSYYVGAVQFLEDYPPSATDKAVQFLNVPTGKTGYLTYRSAFTRPTAESDDLVATTGLDASWEVLLVVGAAAQLLSTREPDSSTGAFVAEQLEREGYPVGSASRQRDNLVRYYEFLRRRLVLQWQSQFRTTVVHRGAVSAGLGVHR